MWKQFGSGSQRQFRQSCMNEYIHHMYIEGYGVLPSTYCTLIGERIKFINVHARFYIVCTCSFFRCIINARNFII